MGAGWLEEHTKKSAIIKRKRTARKRERERMKKGLEMKGKKLFTLNLFASGKFPFSNENAKKS
jgi:hypothetical protein